MTRIIMINGEPKVGKSTFAKDLRDSLNYGWHPTIAETFSLVAPVHFAIAHLFKHVRMVSQLGTAEEFMTTVKESVIAGKTGRQWMIEMGNDWRSHDPDIFIHIFIEHFKNIIDPIEYAIIDNWGFENELAAMLHYAPQHWVIDTVYLDRRATREYMHNEQFDFDNRIALPNLAEWNNPTVRQMADYLQPAMQHGQIAERFNFDTHPGTWRALDYQDMKLRASIARVEKNPTTEGLIQIAAQF